MPTLRSGAVLSGQAGPSSTVDLTLPSPPLPAPTTSRSRRPPSRASSVRGPTPGGSRVPAPPAVLDVVNSDSDEEDEERGRRKRPRRHPSLVTQRATTHRQPSEVIVLDSSPEVHREQRGLEGLHLPPNGVFGVEEGRPMREASGVVDSPVYTLRTSSRVAAASGAGARPGGSAEAGPSRPDRKRQRVRAEPAWSPRSTPSTPIPSTIPTHVTPIPNSVPNTPAKALTPHPDEPQLLPMSTYTCPICFSPPDHATLTPCGHLMCGECLYSSVRANLERMRGTGRDGDMVPMCPVCRAKIGLVGSRWTKNAAVGIQIEEEIDLS